MTTFLTVISNWDINKIFIFWHPIYYNIQHIIWSKFKPFQYLLEILSSHQPNHSHRSIAIDLDECIKSFISKFNEEHARGMHVPRMCQLSKATFQIRDRCASGFFVHINEMQEIIVVIINIFFIFIFIYHKRKVCFSFYCGTWHHMKKVVHSLKKICT